MGVHEYQLVDLDRALLVGGADGLEFDITGAIDATAAPDLYVGDDPATAAARDAFAADTRVAQGMPLAELTFEDVHVSGPHNLVIDRERRRIWTGSLLGWGPAMMKIEVVDHLGGTMRGQDVALLDDRIFGDPQGTPYHHELRGIGMPGYGVYGHWLIDVLPRLVAIRESRAAERLFASAPAPYAARMAALIGVDLADAVRPSLGGVVRVDRFHLRTLNKARQVIDRATAAAAWHAFRTALAEMPLKRNLRRFGPRVYVSRARWNSRRRLANGPEIEAVMREAGYAVLRPENFSLRAQLEIFSRAEHVVGEDGSGLHNIIFSGPGTRLTVIDMQGRSNTFHGSVANVGHQHVSHVGCDLVEDRYRMPPERLLTAAFA